MQGRAGAWSAVRSGLRRRNHLTVAAPAESSADSDSVSEDPSQRRKPAPNQPAHLQHLLAQLPPDIASNGFNNHHLFWFTKMLMHKVLLGGRASLGRRWGSGPRQQGGSILHCSAGRRATVAGGGYPLHGTDTRPPNPHQKWTKSGE